MKNIREILNHIYKPIVDKSNEIVTALSERQTGFNVTSGFYNGHYHKGSDAQYQADVYPIAVIGIMGLCDIEIDFDGISVTTKLSKGQAQAFNWKKLDGTFFEVYGVNDI